MSDRPEDNAGEQEQEQERLANRLTLEIAFLIFIGIVVVAAFVEALGYELVSSRTPFVIMVPLLLLIGIHGARLYRVSDKADFGVRIRAALTRRIPAFNKVVSMSVWMGILLLIIGIFGHFIGIFAFGMFLMRGQARERWILSLAVVGGTTLALFLLFEIGFNVELYRGLIWRWYMGYRVF